MGALNSIVSKFNVTADNTVAVYKCPGTKNLATVDLTFFKDDSRSDALIAVGLSTNTNPAALTSVDFFIDDIEIIGTMTTNELNKVLVGKEETLYVKLLSGPPINVRVTGMEENNPLVEKSGRLAAGLVNATTPTVIYDIVNADTAYVSASITVFNVAAVDAVIELWISNAATPGIADKILKINVTPKDTAIIENIQLNYGEKIIAQSSQSNAEFFVNGTIVRKV